MQHDELLVLHHEGRLRAPHRAPPVEASKVSLGQAINRFPSVDGSPNDGL
jgi:hypothetical protein